MGLSKSDINKKIVLVTLIILIVDAAQQFYLWSRQWVGGEQIPSDLQKLFHSYK
jgi:hypothetical protein